MPEDEEAETHLKASALLGALRAEKPLFAEEVTVEPATQKRTRTSMIALEVGEQELKARLLERAKTSGRADDADPGVIQNRINTYNKETAPVKNYYDTQGKYRGVDGLGSIEEITNRLIQVIDSL